MRATARSCSSGGSRTSTAPHRSASSSTSATAAGSALGWAVTAQGRPSKSAALAARGPERSLPAIGCDPTYRRRTSGSTAAATSCSGRDFTLPTSVTTASRPGERADEHLAEQVGRHGHDDQLGAVLRLDRAAGAEPRGGPDVLGRDVGEQHVEAGPPAGQGDRGAEEAGADDEHRPAQRGHRASGTERTRVRSLRSDAAPWR